VRGRLVVIMAALAVLAWAAPARAAAGCAWFGETDQRDVNIGAPDLDAFYWLDALHPDAGATVTVTGQYPHARYFSLHVYDAQGDALGSIYDAQIDPDPGSANPFRRSAGRQAQGRYTVHIAYQPTPARRAPNTIYVAPAAAGQAAMLVYRVYVPRTPADPSGDVGFPEVETTIGGQATLEQGGCATTPPPFGSLVWQEEAQADYPAVAPTGSGAAATRIPTWTRSFGSKLGNQQNAYLGAILSRQFGDLVVVHTRAPTFPDTLHGVPAYAPRQLRYWSFCTYDDQGEAGFGCAADYAAAKRHRTLTYVVSDPGQRPRNATAAHGVTWLPWGGTQGAIQLVYRNMLPAPRFRYAVQRIKPGQSAQAVMGRYYPQAAYCSKAVFERSGWRGCFAAAGLA
jgi:Protein of unknown function (DUF1214)